MGTSASGGGGNKAAVSSSSSSSSSLCSSSSWIFHSIMAGAQIAFIAFVTIVCDLTKRIPGHGPLYLGHLLTASAIVYLGVYNMHIPLHQPWYKTMIQEGLVAIAFGCFYITSEFITNDRPWRKFGHWGDHIMMSFWIMVFGYMSLVVGQNRAVNFSKIPILITTVGFVMFIGMHPQSNRIAYVMHYSSAFWAALGGVTKIFGSGNNHHPSSSSHLLVVAGVCFIQSGYLFFAGQMKMIMWADDPNHLVIPSIYLLFWHIIGSTVSALYMTNILRGDNHRLSSLVIVDHRHSSSSSGGHDDDYGFGGIVHQNNILAEETVTLLLDEEDDDDKEEEGEV